MIRPKWDTSNPTVNKAVKILTSTRSQTRYHITDQVHAALDVYTATGEGIEILEHYISHDKDYLKRVFYFNGEVYDYNDHEVERWSRANRHNKWYKVLKFDAGPYAKNYR